MDSISHIRNLLTSVIDPELAINIVELGLVYDITLIGETVSILMTLTTPACPFVDIIEEQIESVLDPEGYDVVINYTFDPPWSLDKISPAIRAERGL
jgi:metal-sulfur cluster biosynthetic enzyme